MYIVDNEPNIPFEVLMKTVREGVVTTASGVSVYPLEAISLLGALLLFDSEVEKRLSIEELFVSILQNSETTEECKFAVLVQLKDYFSFVNDATKEKLAEFEADPANAEYVEMANYLLDQQVGL